MGNTYQPQTFYHQQRNMCMGSHWRGRTGPHPTWSPHRSLQCRHQVDPPGPSWGGGGGREEEGGRREEEGGWREEEGGRREEEGWRQREEGIMEGGWVRGREDEVGIGGGRE